MGQVRGQTVEVLERGDSNEEKSIPIWIQLTDIPVPLAIVCNVQGHFQNQIPAWLTESQLTTSRKKQLWTHSSSP